MRSNTALRALVADYDTEAGAALVTMLRQAQSVTIEADLVGWLQTAIQSATIRKYDVVFLGLHLPNGQGIDAARKFMLDVPLTPIIVVSDVFDPEVAEQCTAHGAQGYLVKGSATPELLEIFALTAIRRAEREIMAKESTRRSLCDMSEAPTATSPKLVKAHVAELNAAVREVQLYVATDAPAHAPAVRSILERRNFGALAHEVAQHVELDGERWDDETPVEGQRRARKTSDTALRVMRNIIDRRSDIPNSSAPSTPAEATAAILDVIERRGGRAAGGAKT